VWISSPSRVRRLPPRTASCVMVGRSPRVYRAARSTRAYASGWPPRLDPSVVRSSRTTTCSASRIAPASRPHHRPACSGMKASMSFGCMETRSCSLRMPGPGRGLQPRSGHSRLHCACSRAGTWHRGSRCTRAGVKARPETAKGGTLLQPLRWTEHFLQDDGALQITAPEQPPACTSATLQGLDLGSVVDLRVELRVPAYRRWQRLLERVDLRCLRCTVDVALTK